MRCHKPHTILWNFRCLGHWFLGTIPYLSVMFIFCLLLIMSRNGWKLKLQGLMILKLLEIFIKSNIFSKFGISRALISDQGIHFCNRTVVTLLRKYQVTHKVSTAYHLQTSGQEKCQIERSSPSLKRRSIQVEKIGVWAWVMPCGHIILHIRRPLVWNLIGWCLGNHATFQLS